MYFVDGKEIVPPLKAIEVHTPEHPCYVALQQRKEQSWFMYDFHLTGDLEKKFQLAILCFHLPQKGSGPSPCDN